MLEVSVFSVVFFRTPAVFFFRQVGAVRSFKKLAVLSFSQFSLEDHLLNALVEKG